MFTATFVSIIQDITGDIKTTISYSNGQISISESYTDANASTIKSTINSRLAQLNEAYTFVTANPQDSSTTSPIQ